ncbi:MAG: alkaline phosphatase D family protein [Halioglobus sp.]
MSSSTFILTASPLAVFSATLPQGGPGLVFAEGVASADPQPDAVMLWTRAEPVSPVEQVKVLIQVSTSADFSSPVMESIIETTAESDYTVRVYVQGLKADTRYFYRFIGPQQTLSRTGRTRTAPAAEQAKDVNLAFVSCQSFEQAYYGAWARMVADDKTAVAKDQIQFVLQLGDFIYERSWNTREDGSEQTRRVPDFPDGVISEHNRHAVSLADYRHLYKTYLRDPHLQDARARWPFISIWDDHEFSNDNYQSYTTYGSSRTPEPQRKLNANQAWFEFVPAVLSDNEQQPAHDFHPGRLTDDEQADNVAAKDSLCIYRKLSWGKHLDLVLTDTRSYRTAPCLPDHYAESLGLPLNSVQLIELADHGAAYNKSNPPEHLPYGDGTIANPWRDRAPGSCMGQTQRDWFLRSLDESRSTWKLWGNALPLLPMRIDLSALPLTDYEDSVVGIDAWAGYPHEMNLLMSHLRDQKIPGVVSLSGDHHMHGAGTVSWTADDLEAKPLAADFAVAGISSTPFFESIVAAAKNQSAEFADMVYSEEENDLVPLWHMTMLQGVLASYTYAKTSMETVANWLGPNNANPGLRYMDCTANGYGLAQFHAGDMQVQLIGLSRPREPFKTPPEIGYRARFRLNAWSAGDHPVLEGPTFDGDAPFPFKEEAV